jgi:hypothetical protein
MSVPFLEPVRLDVQHSNVASELIESVKIQE